MRPAAFHPHAVLVARAPTRATPWVVSLGLHAALGALAVAALGRGARWQEPEPAALPRLVFVEPAPPAAPALGHPAAEDGAGASLSRASEDAQAAAALEAAIPPGRTRPAVRESHPRTATAASPPKAAVPDAVPDTAPALAPLAARARELPPLPSHGPGRGARTVESAPVPGETAPPPAVAPATRDRSAPAPVTSGSGAARGDAQGIAGGSGDVVGGTADGVAGGTIGGLGDTLVPVGRAAERPVLLERVVPAYPRRARAAGVEGRVLLEAVVGRDGAVEPPVRVLRSIPLLDQAATAAVARWRFRAARDRAGRPIRVIMEIPLRFVLDEGRG